MSPRNAVVLCLSLLALSACRSVPLPPPETPPALGERRAEPPALDEATVRLQLAFPLSGVVALAKRSLVLPQSPEFQRVTGAGDNPEVEARYASTLSGIDLEGSARALTAVAHVDYHATLRARARTPFGRIWLTKGSDWGTPEQPGRISLTLRTRLSITSDWKLQAKASLTKVALTAPATKKICSSGPFKLCIDGGLMEREIHRRLEAEVRAQVESELSKLERGLAEQVPLRDAAQSLWEGLVSAGGEVGLAPVSLGVEGPSVSNDQLALELLLRAKPLAQGERGGSPAALPKASGKFGDSRLPLQVSVRYDALDGLAEPPLPFELADGDAELVRVQVRGPAAEPSRHWLAAHVHRGDDTRAIHFSARLASQGTDLVLLDVKFSEGSRAWLDATQLAPALEAWLRGVRYGLAPLLQRRRDAIARALSGAAGLLLPLSVVGASNIQVSGVHTGEGELIVQGVAR